MTRVIQPIRETTIAVRVRTCMRPGCGHDAKCRGLCLSDYRVAHQLVAAGSTTWADLERHGRVAQPLRGGPQLRALALRLADDPLWQFKTVRQFNAKRKELAESLKAHVEAVRS
jgi:hypothetical protein